MELFSPGHLITLAVIALVLFFGWKQLPDMARSAGRSLRVFRTEVKGMADDDATRAAKSALSAAKDGPDAPTTPPLAVPPATPPAVAPTAASAEDGARSDAPGQPAG